MTSNLLWYVLAGVLLGFAASTLWEWLYFRQKRMTLDEERIRELEMQLAEEQALVAQLREAHGSGPVRQQPEYASPGVFLDSETPIDANEIAPAGAPAPPSLATTQLTPESAADERTAAQPVAVAVAATQLQDADTPAFDAEPETDVNSLERLAAELAQDPDDLAVAAAAGNRQRHARRSKDHPDDLSLIKGIGHVYKFRLYAAGIFTWHQVAESDVATLRVATNAYPGSNVEEWGPQARALAEKSGREGAYYTGSVPDDLTQIVGIGPANERTLFKAGICTYDQLAGATVSELRELFPIAIAGDAPDFSEWIRMAIEHANSKRRR